MKEEEKVLLVSLDDIIPNRFQPRLAFDEEELNSLAKSIIKYGVIQPIVLRQIGEKYEIIAGERRYKASILAGLKVIPAIIKNTDDDTSAEIALLENLQRQDLTAIEEAKSFKKLLDRGMTQESIASKLGISQSSIANKIRLLNLPKEVQDSLLYNKISERHARCLLSLNSVEEQNKLLELIINNKLTVRQTEDEVNRLLGRNIIDIKEDVFETKEDMLKSISEQYASIINKDEEVPEVVEINNDANEFLEEEAEIENINPFQSIKKELKNILKEKEEDKNTKTEAKTEENIKKPKNFTEFVGVIHKFVNGMSDKLVVTKGEEVGNKYRITIEIDKDTIK